jgi:hypothetical protein
MSLASSPDFQIRPEDKVFEAFFPAEDQLTNSFDDYFNENSDLSDGDNKETFDNFLDFFEKEATGRSNGCLSPIGGGTRQKASPAQPWRKGLWCLTQNGASLPASFLEDKGGGTQNTNGHAGNKTGMPSDNTAGKAFTNFSRPVPRPRPQTPLHKETKGAPTTSPRTARKTWHAQRTFSREGTLSPKSSYARNQHNNKMAYQESLQLHLQNFHLLAKDDAGALSTPSPGRSRQLEHAAQVSVAHVARNCAIVHNQAVATPNADAYDLYPSIEHGHAAVEPGLELGFYSTSSNTALTTLEQVLSSADYIPDLDNQTDTDWAEETFNASIGSEYPFDSQAGYKYVGEMQQSWSPPATSTTKPDAPRSYQQQYAIIAAPTPHRPTHQLLQNPVSSQVDGLGIHYSGIDASTTGRAFATLSPLEPAYSYLPVPEIAPEPIHTFTDASPFTTPRHYYPTDLSPSRSTSPSISLNHTKHNYAATSRSLHQTSPTRQSGRRKSIGAPKASSFTNSHHTSKTPRTPRTPKTPSGPVGVIDFVNFTPKDSAKLLSDVAPSGSSKTRARREQEARDKRRRLSEAAVRAVRRAAKAAGADVGNGEVEALERAILA